MSLTQEMINELYEKLCAEGSSSFLTMTPEAFLSAKSAAEARGVAKGREWCALMADVLGWKGRADERTSDYEQGARDMADRLSAHFRSASACGFGRSA